MLHTCQIDCAAVGGAAVGKGRRFASGRIETASRLPWSCRRSWDDAVADNVAPKRRSTNRLCLLSPKTCFTTERLPRQNATPLATAGVLQKTTSPKLAKKSCWPTRQKQAFARKFNVSRRQSTPSSSFRVASQFGCGVLVRRTQNSGGHALARRLASSGSLAWLFCRPSSICVATR